MWFVSFLFALAIQHEAISGGIGALEIDVLTCFGCHDEKKSGWFLIISIRHDYQ